MKKYALILSFLLIFFGANFVHAEDYESLKLINSKAWAKYFDDLLGYPYDSHGCLHFAPADIYLLAKTIPAGIPLTIKKYELTREDGRGTMDEGRDKSPYLIDLIKSEKDVQKNALMFKTYRTELIFYPLLNKIFIMVNGSPYAQVKALAGPRDDMLMAFDVKKGRPIEWDFMLSTPTDPGEYKILRATSHYISNAYYNNTIVPFGAWIMKRNGVWSYQKEAKWYKLPKHIVDDLKLPPEKRQYNYFDVSASAARWASHDFGQYVLLWTQDGKNYYPEMGYAAGELLYERIILIKDLVHILTLDSQDDFDYCVSRNKNFSFYKGLYDFVESKGKTTSTQVDPAAYSYYRLYNGLDLTKKDYELMDPRLVKAFKEYKENRLPRDNKARLQARGLYNYLRINSLVIEKQAGWYEGLKKDWDFYKKLRIKLREDFDKMGILSIENRQNLVEKWLNERLEFKIASPPKYAKYMGELSFSTFFKPDEESFLFTQRERDIMRERIRKAASGKEKGLNLQSVDALNDYNFGLLLNEILGDLYKSHGCMHVSPRNAKFLYELLPVGAKVTIYDYSKKISEEALADVPYLSNIVNFKDDLENLKEKFAATSEAQVVVYPFSGVWVVYLKNKPFARLTVRGGPQAKMYLVQGRDDNGKPRFEDHLAYPTTPGTYYVFKKVKDYLSNIYYDTTVIPMGGIIKKREDGKWIFQGNNGDWKSVPKSLQLDLSLSPDERGYTYYDSVMNSSGEVVSVKWGSHPFGKYALRTTVNKKSPFPELIHSSGDLMMEERQLINDIIKILSAPYDKLEQCVKSSPNFDLYKTCYDFVKDPSRDLIQARERGAYKLYFGLPLTSVEASALPLDVIAANKVLKNQKLGKEEIDVLVDEGIARQRRGVLKFDMPKILGLQFDTYQYVVTIQKFANHYRTLDKHWKELTALRRALLKDFNDFVLKDPQLFHSFMRELMLKRTALEKLSQDDALGILNGML